MSISKRVDRIAKRIAEEAPGPCMSITITVSPEIDALIDNMAEELGVPKGGAIGKGIGLLKIALDARREGKKLMVVDDEFEEEVLVD